MMGAVLLVAQVALSSALGSGQGASDRYEIYNPLLYAAQNVLFGTALLLFVVALLGLYARRAPHSGWLRKAGSLLALAAGVLVISATGAFAAGPWPRFAVLLVLSTQVAAILCLVVGLALLGIPALRTAALRDWASNLRWRGVLLILATGLGAALLSDALERIMNSSYLGLKGNHLLHVLVTIPVAAWVARKVGTTPVLYGLVVGLISGIANQIVNHAILQPGSMTWYEISIILVSCVVAGGLGGIIAYATMVEQETLYRASQAIGVVASLQDIVDAIGKHLADPQVSHVALWQDASSDAEDGASAEISLLAVWMPLAARIWGPGVWRPGLRLDTTKVPALTKLHQRSPLVLRTRKLPATERAVWEHQGIRSAVLLPLVTSSGSRVGLLMVASRGQGFSRVKERTYLTIGAQVALVLENLRLIEQAQQAGVSSERQRLAQEIHDTLAQAFTSIVMKLEAAEGALPTDPGSVRRFLDQARGIARESLAEARRLMWALRPESLERSSLPEALARLAERWSEECGVSASTTVTGTPHPLTPDTEVTLMRVAQEALTNCRKYAQARQVTIALSYMNNLVTLNVQDDGVGFDPAELHPDSSDQSTGGYGLVGVRERVEQLRGTMLIESTPGEGATLMVAIPVTADKRVPGVSAQAARTPPALPRETS